MGLIFIVKITIELSVINYGFDILDEGFYLLSTKNSEIDPYIPSHFQVFFYYLPESILGLRYIKFIDEILYIIIFTLVIFFLKRKEPFNKSKYFFSLLITSCFYFNYNSKSFSYHDIITFTSYLTLALTFFFIQTRKLYLMILLSITIGILFCTQIIVKFTTPIILFPPLILYILYFYRTRIKNFLLGFITGIVSFILIYLSKYNFVNSYNTVKLALTDNLNAGHSVKSLGLNFINYIIILTIFLITISIISFSFINYKKRRTFYMLIISIIFFLFSIKYFAPNYFSIFGLLDLTSFSLLLPSITYFFVNKLDFKSKLIIVFVIFLPSIIVFGSNVQNPVIVTT